MHELRLGVKVANVVISWWLEVDIVNLATDRTIASSCHSLLEIILWHVDQDRDNAVALFGRELFQTHRLLRSSREAVEDVAVARIVLRSALFDELNCQIVGNKLAPLHNLSHFVRERSLGSLQGPKDIPC